MPRSQGPEGKAGSPASSRSRAPVADQDCQPLRRKRSEPPRGRFQRKPSTTALKNTGRGPGLLAIRSNDATSEPASNSTRSSIPSSRCAPARSGALAQATGAPPAAPATVAWLARTVIRVASTRPAAVWLTTARAFDMSARV